MNKIYKYELKITDTQVIKMPNNAQILCAQLQNGTPKLWARVDTDAEPEERKIEIYGAGGRPLDEHELLYIGTVQMTNGLVWHIFENR